MRKLCLTLAGVLFLQIFGATAQNTHLDKQLRIAVDAGYSYRWNGRYIQKARSGVNFGGDVLWFDTETWGYGAKYSGRSYSAESGGISQKTQIHYLAPMAGTATPGYSAFQWGSYTCTTIFRMKETSGRTALAHPPRQVTIYAYTAKSSWA